MSIKEDITTALQLFLLLCLLFWSLTWNIPSNFEASQQSSYGNGKSPKQNSKQADMETKNSIQYWNKHYLILESFQKFKHVGKNVLEITSSENSMIPSFDEWKKQELTKQEKTEKEKEYFAKKKKPAQRKLNYSSSKCGAKVLASNPEAKHRMAILNEKADEYMLNPCRAKSWFVIELCDTIEATQIELANYELYSSSPKKFSVFWSETFPSQAWHHLGTFEATNQRTMQSFDIDVRNLGKFFKIVIINHHGKEHYCLLSVIRILGYSMVYEFEETDDHDKFKEDLDNKSILFSDQVQNRSTEKGIKTFAALSIHCLDLKQKTNKTCSSIPICRFLDAIMQKSDNKLFVQKFHSKNESYEALTHDKKPYNAKIINYHPQCNVPSKWIDNNQSRRIKFPRCSVLDVFYYLNPSHQANNVNANAKNKTPKAMNEHGYYRSVNPENNTTNNTSKTKIVNDTKNEFHSQKYKKDKKPMTHLSECNCEKNFRTLHDVSEPNFFPNIPDSYTVEDGLDSAGLLQKESVLVRLTARIKASETNLGLINKYLQQLSQSYRLQMEDMQSIFNETVKAVTLASEKALIIDNKQQQELAILKNKLVFLSSQIDYLMAGQKDSLKLVMEMHAFFLVLQLTIISTIFTILVNNLNQKCSLAEKAVLNCKREQLYFNIINRNSKHKFKFKKIVS